MENTKWNVGWGTGLSGPRCAFTVYINEESPYGYIPIRNGEELIAIVPIDTKPRAEKDARLIAAAPKTKRDKDALLAVCEFGLAVIMEQHRSLQVITNGIAKKAGVKPTIIPLPSPEILKAAIEAAKN